MKIYKLSRKGTAAFFQDTVDVFIIVAASAPDARDLAARRAMDEGPETWKDAGLSVCRAVGTASEHLRNKTRHVLAVQASTG